MLVFSMAVVGSPLLAQGDFEDVSVRVEKVAPGIYMLEGAGGNIGASIGKDGIFLVDDQYAPLTEKIRTALATIDDGPVRFVLNTHWHGDHTGGNENLGRAGSLIVAHDDVRTRMSAEQFVEAFDRKFPASPQAALPVVTFSRSMTFHLNGDEIHSFHVPQAHTDGDSIVHFRRADVLHMGDVYWSGMYPLIDYSTGGSIDGMIDAVETALGLATAKTRIIPGHGPLTGREGLVAYRDMLRGVRDAVASLVGAGKTLEETVALKPTAEFDEAWGQGFIKPDGFVEIVVRSLER